MRRILMIVGAVLVLQAVGAFLFAWSGLYSVAASKDHWPPTTWFLEMAMRNSIETHAMLIDAPDLDDMALIRRGAGHYEDGCAPCHGAPDARRNPISRHMLPAPPFLPDVVKEWEPEQLYWITRHGIKYAGMPAWPARQRDDEPWAVAAFLRRLDTMDAAEYRRLAFGEEPPTDDRSTMDELEGGELEGGELEGPVGEVLRTCARCHGYDGAGHGTGAFPRLAGQKADYLYESLRAYASGARPSGIMQPMAAGLDEGVMRALADHYARQTNAPYPPAPEEGDPRLRDLGANLASAGDPERGVPACSGCHGPNRDPRYPSLDGQHAGIIADQVRLWQKGARGDTALSRIMAAAARDLTEEQIRAVSLHYARIRPQRTAEAP